MACTSLLCLPSRGADDDSVPVMDGHEEGVDHFQTTTTTAYPILFPCTQTPETGWPFLHFPFICTARSVIE